jgi:hypothetical protein
MNQKKTTNIYYQIQYSLIKELNVWHSGDSYKSYVEACQEAHELAKTQSSHVISNYRIVENVVVTNTEVLKIIPKI